MNRMIALGFVVATLALTGCVYAPSEGYDDREYIRPTSPAHVKHIVREVLDKEDIPTPFTGCTGSHRMRSNSSQTEYGTSFSVTENNSRTCPEVQLN